MKSEKSAIITLFPPMDHRKKGTREVRCISLHEELGHRQRMMMLRDTGLPTGTVMTPAGVLNEDTKGFEITSHEVNTIPLDTIEQIAGVPDFGRSEAFHPTVFRTPKGVFCADGFEKIEEARASGATEIRAEIFDISDHSRLDLVLRKLTNRLAPRGGVPLYANIINVVSKGYDLLVRSDEALKPLTHGGARTGARFTNNRAVDGKEILALRLNKDRDTINSYLNHAKFLDEDTLKELIELEAGKGFFETIQAEKSKRVTLLEEKGATKAEITAAIAKLVREWFEEASDNEGDVTFRRPKPGYIARSNKAKAGAAPGITATPQEEIPKSESPRREPENHTDEPKEDTQPHIGVSITEAGRSLAESGTRIGTGLPDTILLLELTLAKGVMERVLSEINPVISLLEKRTAA